MSEDREKPVPRKLQRLTAAIIAYMLAGEEQGDTRCVAAGIAAFYRDIDLTPPPTQTKLSVPPALHANMRIPELLRPCSRRLAWRRRIAAELNFLSVIPL